MQPNLSSHVATSLLMSLSIAVIQNYMFSLMQARKAYGAAAYLVRGKSVVASHGEVSCCSNKEETHPSRAGTDGSSNSCTFSFISSRTTASYKSYIVV